MVFRPAWVIVLIILGVLLVLIGVAVLVTLTKYFHFTSGWINGSTNHSLLASALLSITNSNRQAF